MDEQVVTDRYALYRGDAIELMRSLPDASADLVVYSPPFGGLLYQYSSDPRDLSNSKDYAEFFEHYRFAVEQIARVLRPGRMTAVHCMDIPTGSSFDEAVDFPGEIIRLHERLGFTYTGRHVVWKEPLTVRNRTMLRSLHHKTLTEDSLRTSLAHADYILRLRRDGKARNPVPHPVGLLEYSGERLPPAAILRYRGWPGDQTENQYSQWIWRQYASSVWDDVRLDHVLSYREAREEDDEAHIHPLQLDTINRCLALWTNPDETVLSPFAGVGSEMYAAILAGRRAIGMELKASYFRQAVRHCAAALEEWRAGRALPDQADLFGDGAEAK